MKRVLLFGAGQVGAMTARLLGTEYRALCFADNMKSKWGGSLLGLPILSPEEGLALEPDCAVLCVLDGERAAQMEEQLRALGFAGELMRPDGLRRFDVRVGTMRLLAEQLNALAVLGDVAELGVYRGDFAALLCAAFPDRRIHLFDTFEGFSERDLAPERSLSLSRAKAGDFSETGVELVRAALPPGAKAVFHPGWFPESFRGCEEERFAFVSVDPDLYAPTAAALPLFFDRLSPGGVLLIHDVNSGQFSGPGKAVAEFCARRGLLPLPLCDLHGSVVIRK